MEEALTPQQCRQAFSYERLENVGDSLLKFATCTALFSTHPTAHEGSCGLRDGTSRTLGQKLLDRGSSHRSVPQQVSGRLHDSAA